jgi:hypothetical protein
MLLWEKAAFFGKHDPLSQTWLYEKVAGQVA